MSSSADGYVQVAVDGSGKKIRNVEEYITLSDGSEHKVECQVVAQVGPDGRIVDGDTTKMLSELIAIRELLEEQNQILRDAFALDLRQALAKKGGRSFSKLSTGIGQK